ncbi:MAG TPA: FliM/FliN family flagellar motor switch protein [Burkholderiaceae bacterium]|nr:FliM/FliN family flagellar motor switch protein [Burkholderiaceae bacterium]
MLELARNAPQVLELPNAADTKEQGAALFDGHLGLIQGVKVRLAASLGSASLTVAELFALKDGSVVKLDRTIDEPVDIVLEGQVIARGRLVAVDDSFGVSITEIAAGK